MPRFNESNLQQSCVRWFRYQYPDLKGVFFAVPNGGARNPITAAILKSEGVLPGVSDLMLAKASNHYHGLFIEMKTDKGRQQPSQRDFEANITERGYKYIIVRSFEDFQTQIVRYLLNEK